MPHRSCHTPNLYRKSAIGCALLAFLLSSCARDQQSSSAESLLSTHNRKIHLHGEPYQIRGICYQPTPIGENASKEPPFGDYFSRNYQALYERDIPHMRAMGANVVRLYAWDPSKDHNHFLDTLYNQGDRPLRVLINQWINPETNWDDPSQVQAIADQYLRIAQNAEDHPAVLGFLIGNETNAHHGNGDKPAFWKAMNHIAKALKAKAPNRLVSIAITDVLHQVKRFDSIMAGIDTWSIQVYRGLTLGNFYDEYEAVSQKPLIITEFGLDAYDGNARAPYPENAKFVAETVGKMIVEMEKRSDVCSGGCIFEFSDEWWKSDGSPAEQDAGGLPGPGYPDKLLNEEWWGIFEVRDNGTNIDTLHPRALYHTLKNLWSENE